MTTLPPYSGSVHLPVVATATKHDGGTGLQVQIDVTTGPCVGMTFILTAAMEDGTYRGVMTIGRDDLEELSGAVLGGSEQLVWSG